VIATSSAAVPKELRDETIVAKPAMPSPLPVDDPADRWVLAPAVVGKPDMLVTGDEDLLAVAARSPIAVVTPRGCWAALRQSE